METRQIHEAALQKGAHVQALDDIAALVLVHFGEDDVSPKALDAYLSTLDVWTLRGIDYETFDALPPAERLAMHRAYKPQPQADLHPRRPTSRPLTETELASIEGLPWAERRERARAMQHSPAPSPDAT